LGRSLLGSANQTIHFLTDRHGPADFDDIPRPSCLSARRSSRRDRDRGCADPTNVGAGLQPPVRAAEVGKKKISLAEG